MERYRHEFKFLCDERQLAVLQHRLEPVMRRDPYAGESGSYRVRSVYFDDIYRQCRFDNENGNDPRGKFRIRIYNGSLRPILLEKKIKREGMTRKEVCRLDEAECRALLAEPEQTGLEVAENRELFGALLTESRTKLLRPVVLIDYDRTPFVCENGKVRITFDRSISASSRIESFFEKAAPLTPVLPAGIHILEVKHNDWLPEEIRRLLNTGFLQQTAFSKYYFGYQAVLGEAHHAII